MERGNLSPRCEGRTSSRDPDKRESTDAEHRGGSARSSEEVPVMGMERRGRHDPADQRGPTGNGMSLSGIAKPFEWSVMKSRMTGDCHVRFCERLGVKFPRSTRLNLIFSLSHFVLSLRS